MYNIDLTLKNSPVPLSVQRKEKDDALELYREIVEAMRSGIPQVLELTCEKQPDKQVAVLSERISAAMVSEKSGSTASGKAPGFFAAAEN